MISVLRNRNVVVVTLNRPEKRNALNIELCQQLIAALEEANAEPEVRAILLARMEKHFVPGCGLNEITKRGRFA